MLQPRGSTLLPFAIFLALTFALAAPEGLDNVSPRRRRQDSNDVTTVLLVDNHGRSSFGRYLNVKPDLGLITSTARTFIQEGVTTEYATQVLGTTLDNGRLYAHLLTKSSRVLYDGAEQQHPTTSSSSPLPSTKKWNFVVPTRAEPMLVFPTTQPEPVRQQITDDSRELLEEEPSNNPRVPFEEVLPINSNVKIFKINPHSQVKDLENLILKDEQLPVKALPLSFAADKVRPWDNLPTFTVRNEFSPSGFSYLGDFPEFDTSNTERSKNTASVNDRKAKLLFRAGLVKPEPKDFQTVTYSGFADFTTTVGDTVIVFSPHTSAVPQAVPEKVTKITVQPTIRPSLSIKSPKIGSTIKTFLSHEPAMETQTVEGHKIEMKTMLPTMVIDKSDRMRRPKQQESNNQQISEDMEAKSSVLAHEQQGDSSLSGKSTILFSPEVIEPSESQTPMLSTPSHEDIAKIFASLQAQANRQATEPLNTPSTIFLDESSTPASTEQATEISSGATTIFFEDDLPIENTGVVEKPQTSVLTTTTTEKEQGTTTTEQNDPTTNAIETTTSEEITTTEEEEERAATTPEIVSNEIDTEAVPHLVDVVCTEGSQIVPTTVYKTLTYLTTFFIPEEDTTTTSVKSNRIVSTEIGFETKPCSSTVAPSSVLAETEASSILTTTEKEVTTTQEIPTTTNEIITTTEEEHEQSTEPLLTTTDAQTTPALDSTPTEITTERRHVTESDIETTEMTTESGEEIELIFKTLYTTYTYLTTFFQDTTSSIASKIVVTTNVITSTLVPGSEASDSAVAGFIDQASSRTVSFDDLEITPTQISDNIQPTLRYSDDEDDDEDVEVQATPILGDKQAQNGVKTYYTTYTYFTTIFVDGETEISSRTEVYTNYVTPSASSTADITPTRVPSLFETEEGEEEEEEEGEKKILSLNVTPTNAYNSTIRRQKTEVPDNFIEIDKHQQLDNNILATTSTEPNYVTLQRGSSTESTNENDYETIATMVTDVRSSTSEGERRVIDNVDKRNVLDDQIVSESNNESEIIPSPTLLLQTSYTTFTYFTTMYHGTTSSNVVSRLETVTNVVTETLTPTHTLSVEDLSLPITYFTTFTYWTTLYKDGTTKVTSREETVSNVVTPTPSLAQTISITPTVTETVASTASSTESIQPSTVGDDDLTTYFTTYTYYTTSYVGDSTVLNSRLETVTNVLNNTAELDSNQIGRAVGTVAATQNQLVDEETKTSSTSSSTSKPTGLLSTIVNTVENSGTTTLLSTDVFGTYIDGLYAKVLESTSSVLTEKIEPSSTVTSENLKPTGVVSINQGKIVDADGVSTLFYTTQAVGTYIDNLYAQVIESTSSLQVNEERKSAIATDVPITHRTGLVRLIEGSIVQNETTTLYQSKVLGTVIDGRYAQIIESTSSFLLGKSSSIAASTTASEIVPTATKAPEQDIAPTSISPSPVVIESSLSDTSAIEATTKESEEDDGSGRVKSRLSFQPRKRTFTPVIRPFKTGGKPSSLLFAPKRKSLSQSTATIVTRSDVTPTVTAVLASKPARFGSGRRGSSSANNIQPTASGSRRFSRPKATSSAGGAPATGFRRSSGRVQPTATSSRRGNFRSSAGGASSQRASSLFPGGNSRFRIRPTASLKLPGATTTPSTDEENDLTTLVTDSPTDSLDDGADTTLPLSATTEGSSRRSQNPLLRFRRPLARPTTPRSVAKTTKKPKTTAGTTPKPRATFARQSSAVNRPRTNSLFPRRNLFTTTTSTTAAPEEEEDDLEELEEEGENEDEDTDYDSSQTNTQTEPAPTPETRRNNNVQIKPFFRKRTRREVNYSRFRRPNSRTTSTTTTTAAPEPETEAPKRFPSRFSSRTRAKPSTTTQSPPPPPTRKRIVPSKASVQSRSQFTLREKNTSTSRNNNYRRISPPGTRTTQSSRPKSPRLRTTSQPEPKRQSSTRNSSSRRRPTSSTRQRNDNANNENYVLPAFDGTITVTHQIPTEVTIPVVNGKITEYKNVITAKYSSEALGPKQYSTSLNAFGKDVTVLVGESTNIGDNGATLITQFVLNETPTTSVIFTPTYIRGRKTSFSHVIPSTAYGVEQVVNTIQPALAAQAPLANILLSQLLLGGLQPQNPLLALQNAGGVAAPATPTTEYKTRATTYVTTVTSETSTVIPLTFRGKEILTTIIDSSVTVLTATEFLTETVVVTPTVAFPAAAPQLNTLLLPLLQQQLSAQQNQLNQAPAGVLNLNVNDRPQAQALFQEPEKLNLAELEEEVEVEVDQQRIEEVTQPATRRKSNRKKNKKNSVVAPVAPPKETSVITLYVSGRTPGEFSTVLSTVVVGEGERRRREVLPSRTYDDLVVSTLDYFDTYVMPASLEEEERGLESSQATESLESIIGDVSRHIATAESTAATKTKNLSSSSKKYKINVVAFDEKAPLMPKVETSSLSRGDDDLTTIHVSKLHVGHENFIRFKRDLRDDDGNSKPKRKVIKKLIRVNPVTTRRKSRRRLVIKKKKKVLVEPKSTRRTVVVTRKRLLPTSTSSAAESTIDFTSSTEEESTTEYSGTSEETTTEDSGENTTEENYIESTTLGEDGTEDYEDEPVIQQLPDYEPSFPLDAPLLLLKTTVIASVENVTKTVLQSRLRTYTFVVTRVNGAESVVTSTTQVKPQTKTIILTEPVTKLTTLTLLDLDTTSKTLPITSTTTTTTTPFPASSSQLKHTDPEEQGRAFEEARYNLATRIMSNGVEVIVAGDKSTLPGEPDVRRVLPSSIYKPVTLKPSTITNKMMMSLPQDANIQDLASLYPNQFVTKTCLTTFTYLTTYLESGTTAISSHEQVVSNIATEERNTGKILPTPAMGITLTQYPNLSVGVFHTTYTYLNTILDGEQPLVVTSKHTVTNTVTAPDDYLSLLQPSEEVPAIKDTNTYYSTVALEKTLYEGDKSQIVSTNEVVTQVVITESVPPKATSVMTSYIALDFDDPEPDSATTTDVTKTYFVTYTYYDTVSENGKKIVKTNVSTSSDVVTEKLFLHQKPAEKKKQKSEENFKIFATKTYHTTFTYFTTLLQENNENHPTVISSHSKVVENVVTETIQPSLLDRKYLKQLRSSLKDGSTESLTHLATLNNGEKMEITIVASKISPTKVLPIEKTQMPAESTRESVKLDDSSTPNVIVGSTIIFLDEEDEQVSTRTPSLTQIKSSSSTKIIKKTASSGSTSKARRSTKTKAKSTASVVPTLSEKKPAASKIAAGGSNQVSDLLGLGSININSLQALTPVLNAMAGLIQTNLKAANRRNDSVASSSTTSNPVQEKDEASPTRSPIYIPVAGISDEIEVAESQNIATFHLEEPLTEWEGNKEFVHESPLLNGGISISPGEVITANSDVIVGKPGRIKPRIPSIPLSQVKEKENDDGFGMKPPPLLQQHKYPKRAHEYKHIPVSVDKPLVHAPSKDDYVGPPPPPEQLLVAQNNYINEIPFRNEEYKNKNTIPIYENNPIKNFAPSIVLPEIIERSTGQPLLVNIQPSQVAFVNIPHNRTTALIYGGSTEQHHNGQYFDDPSPYPEPEFSGIEFNNGVAQFASVYTDSSHQKQVGGVIKVAPQPIRFEQNVKIVPTRPNPEISLNVNVPPISFGMVQKDDDFNGHVIGHEFFNKHQQQQDNLVYVEKQNRDETVDLRPPQQPARPTRLDVIVDLKPPSSQQSNKIGGGAPKRNFNRPSRPEISSFMTPPPFSANRQNFRVRPQKKPLTIPLIPEREPVDLSDDEDDLTNEDGEVIQESNSRPIRPGQVPFEILKAAGQSTTTSTTSTPVQQIRFPGVFEEKINYRPRPVISNPRPFDVGVPFVRPENQQTNQINSFDVDQINYITPRPDPGFITYIGSVTAKPEIRKPSSAVTGTRRRVPATLGTTRKPNYRNHTSSTVLYSFNTRPTTVKPFVSRPVVPTFIPPRPITVSQFRHTTAKPFTTTSKTFVDLNRPKVTSLPIDHPQHERVVPVAVPSQTEIPFRTSKPLSITDLLNREKVTTQSTTHVVPPSAEEAQLEIMKPPLPVLDTEMQPPPKIEINSPGSIKRVPSLKKNSVPDLEAHASSTAVPPPYVPKPSQEFKPPPPPSEQVVGMNPPPLVTTQKTTTSSTAASTARTRPTRRRTTTRNPSPRPNYEIYGRNRTSTTSTTTSSTTTQASTTTTPQLEVIIGNPTLNPPVQQKEPQSTTPKIEIKPTQVAVKETRKEISKASSTAVTSPVHHAGNEVKIVDDLLVLSPSTATRKTSLHAKETPMLLPTRYITHTKTSTVTITKTTVVKTLGGPPSTRTLLVTKTEKSTIVDTVTEFHTLVQPTSIVATVTTTVSTGGSTASPVPLYPSEVYGVSTYATAQINPTPSSTKSTTTSSSVLVIPTVTIVEDASDEEDLEDFIINETDPPIAVQEESAEEANDSIFVVMTDKNKGSVIKVPNGSQETQTRDEVLNSNEVNNVLLGGIFISNPTIEVPRSDKCEPECKASRNELCQKVEGVMRCVCRPGFARMFPDRPCIPTYTYSLQLDLQRLGRDKLIFTNALANPNSTEFVRLTRITHEALDRMVMQSDLRDIYHGIHVHSFEPGFSEGITAKFHLQLSDNTDESRLEDIFKKYLRGTNYSLGGTEMFAARENLDLHARDFDECTSAKYHDCSENAHCFNLKGTYTCSCKEGYSDLSENVLYPGRACSAELIGCERCNYHGTCYSRGDEQVLCECFHWYTGESCHINLKALLIALVTLGTILLVLLLVCIILTCCRKKPRATRMQTGMSFLPQRINSSGSTIDRRAMIQDTSSEDSRSETNTTLPYIQKKRLKGALKKPTSHQLDNNGAGSTLNTITFPDQKDRSLTVMIPRAKYHPAPPTSSLINYTSFDARKPSVPSTNNNEAKLLSYLDAGPTPGKETKRKYSDSYIDEQPSRKTSGALVSAGFEVSATVLANNMGTLGTTCGTEADRSENATLIQKISADLLSSTGTARSQFNALRGNDIDPMANWLDITPRINTVSEARSYDETTIPPPMKSFRGDYDSKPSSQHQNDEANTMAERDLGSTFLLPHTHLYKPDRGSDISGFESL